jgi:hypothetical protein
MWNGTLQTSFDRALPLMQALWPDLEGILLFGSWARGTNRPGSDVDLLIVLGPERPLRRRLYDEWDEQIEPAVADAAFSPHIVRLARDPASVDSLWLEAATTGTVLHDGSGRVTSAVVAIRDYVARGHVVREQVSGAPPYWRWTGTAPGGAPDGSA